jgi:hypothetical protein
MHAYPALLGVIYSTTIIIITTPEYSGIPCATRSTRTPSIKQSTGVWSAEHSDSGAQVHTWYCSLLGVLGKIFSVKLNLKFKMIAR